MEQDERIPSGSANRAGSADSLYYRNNLERFDMDEQEKREATLAYIKSIQTEQHWAETLGTDIDLSREAERVIGIDVVWYGLADNPPPNDFTIEDRSLASLVRAGWLVPEGYPGIR